MSQHVLSIEPSLQQHISYSQQPRMWCQYTVAVEMFLVSMHYDS